MPATLRDIADATSIDVAMKLCSEFGGRDVYIPLDPREGCVVGRLIGLAATRQIVKQVGYGHFHIPLCRLLNSRRRDRAIVLDRSTGLSMGLIAKKHGVHTRTVKRAIDRAGPR